MRYDTLDDMYGNSINKHSSNGLVPVITLSLLLDHGAWLVGSGVPWFVNKCEGKRPKDLDLIVPPNDWCKIVRLLPKHSVQINTTFGGLVFQDFDINNNAWVVDIWPSTVDAFFKLNGFKVPRYAMSMNPYIVLERTNV